VGVRPALELPTAVCGGRVAARGGADGREVAQDRRCRAGHRTSQRRTGRAPVDCPPGACPTGDRSRSCPSTSERRTRRWPGSSTTSGEPSPMWCSFTRRPGCGRTRHVRGPGLRDLHGRPARSDLLDDGAGAAGAEFESFGFATAEPRAVEVTLRRRRLPFGCWDPSSLAHHRRAAALRDAQMEWAADWAAAPSGPVVSPAI
jgi:hypothetical protein